MALTLYSAAAVVTVASSIENLYNLEENISSLESTIQRPLEEQQIILRHRRGVSLGRLRQVANHIALSEFYRIRGLDTLETLGLVNNGSSENGESNEETVKDPNGSRILSQLFDVYRKDKTLSNIFRYLKD
ncbi:hypothetical protein CHUAL_007473 [Chamberlinius hualienensis]